MSPHYVELILFSTYAELRAERARSYLGLIWWVLEPAMMMGVFYLVFVLILKTAGPGYLPSLLVGLTIWQWFKSCVSHGGYSIWSHLALIRQVKLPPLVFPIVQILADTIKFLFILGVLLGILWCAGYPPNMTYLALLPVLLIELIFAAGAGFLLASLMPLVPDLRFFIEQFLQVVMFMSGILFALDSVPDPWRDVLSLNPVAVLVDAVRGVLLHARWPDWSALLQVTIISCVMCLAGAFAVKRLTPRYVKVAV